MGRDGHGQWQYPYNPNAPGPNNGGGGAPGPNNGGGGGAPVPNGGNSSNPYNAMILSLAASIAANKQKEEEKNKPSDNTTPLPTPDPSKPAEYDPNYDDIHLIENQLLAVLNAQGLAELTNEQQVAEIDKIYNAMPT